MCVPHEHYSPVHFDFFGDGRTLRIGMLNALVGAGPADFWPCLPYYSKRFFLVAVLKFYCWSAQNIDSLFGSLVSH